MSKTTKTVETIKQALAFNDGEFQDGSYLRSSEDMIDDQEMWDDEDPCKDFDFTLCPYWITTDDGAEPEGIDNDAEFKSFQEGL